MSDECPSVVEDGYEDYFWLLETDQGWAEASKDTNQLCRNVLIYGNCRYEDKGLSDETDIHEPASIDDRQAVCITTT